MEVVVFLHVESILKVTALFSAWKYLCISHWCWAWIQRLCSGAKLCHLWTDIPSPTVSFLRLPWSLYRPAWSMKLHKDSQGLLLLSASSCLSWFKAHFYFFVFVPLVFWTGCGFDLFCPKSKKQNMYMPRYKNRTTLLALYDPRWSGLQWPTGSRGGRLVHSLHIHRKWAATSVRPLYCELVKKKFFFIRMNVVVFLWRKEKEPDKDVQGWIASLECSRRQKYDS